MSDAPSETAPAPAFRPGKPLAYVMGVQWVGVLASKDYPTEWNLLFLQDRVKKNANDTYKDDKPGDIYAGFGAEGQRRATYLRRAVGSALNAYSSTLTSDPRAFYTVRYNHPQPRWFDQQVMFVTHPRILGEATGPDSGERRITGEAQISAAAVQRLVENQVWGISDGNSKLLNPQQLWPSATVDLGERAVGFISLARALRYLEANPQRPVWVMSWDAPDWPKAQQPSENAVLLILTHPQYRHPYPRKPLALLYAPQRVQRDQATSRLAANKTAFAAAAAAANLKLADIGMFHHDAGPMGEPQASAAIGPMFQALTELDAGEELFARTAAVDRYLRNAGANAATLNLAFATALVQHTGKPGMVLGVRDDPALPADTPQAAYAVVLTAPPGHVVPAAQSEWPRARGLGQAYWPWWGELIEPKR